MTARLLLAVLVLASPTLAMAECYGGHEQVTMSCPEGQVFDSEQQSCITPTG